MLEEYLKNYEESANYKLPDWKKLDTNSVINSYVENESSNPILAQAYLSVIFCKYWFYISSFYNKSRNSMITPEECYDWLTDGILLCLKSKAWLNPNNKLFGDPNGPDKAMNICITTRRQAYYQYSNYDRRKINYNIINIENIISNINKCNDLKDSTTVSEDRIAKIFNYNEKGYDYVDSSIKTLVVKSFKKCNYFLAFMIDNICHYSNVFMYDKNKNTEVFSKKKMCTYMHRLNEKYIWSFSDEYNIDVSVVARAVKENINVLNATEIRKSIDKNLNYLKSILSEVDLC